MAEQRSFIRQRNRRPIHLAAVFGMNRDKLIEHGAVTEPFNATVEMAEQRGLLSGEHFSLDGTLIKAWASQNSIQRKDGSFDGRPPEKWHASGEVRVCDFRTWSPSK